MSIFATTRRLLELFENMHLSNDIEAIWTDDRERFLETEETNNICSKLNSWEWKFLKLAKFQVNSLNLDSILKILATMDN